MSGVCVGTALSPPPKDRRFRRLIWTRETINRRKSCRMSFSILALPLIARRQLCHQLAMKRALVKEVKEFVRFLSLPPQLRLATSSAFGGGRYSLRSKLLVVLIF